MDVESSEDENGGHNESSDDKSETSLGDLNATRKTKQTIDSSDDDFEETVDVFNKISTQKNSFKEVLL
jgi:hypothetical protein